MDMKKFLIILAISCFGLLPVVSGQQKTVYGDEVGTLDGIMKAYYDVVTVKKGEKVSYERDSLLHVPNALVGMVQYNKAGDAKLNLVSLRKFHQDSDPYLEKNGFYETEISRKVENFGAVYQVWSTYETRNFPGGPLLERGINSIQLYFDGKRFWFLSWVFDNESKEHPIPKKYLMN